jgi:surfactin family lipopeptide synthetase C
LRERLPEYMAPETILLVGEIPLTANGKLDRKRLPSVKDAGRQIEQEYAAPQTPVEETLVEIFQDVLKVDQVGIHDNFFDLGGHSLLLTRVVSRIYDAFSLDLPLRALFDAPTIKQLGLAIAANQLLANGLAEASELLQELQGLSAEEVRAMLKSGLNKDN